MGCTQSKIDNEEAVSRCKERKLIMKDAVSARNAFAAAHSSYAVYLKNTGAALNDYAAGEVAQHPPQLVQPNLSSVPAAATFDSFVPPPPPLPDFPSQPLQRAASMPEIKPDPKAGFKPKTIIEEEDEDDEIDGGGGLRVRTRSKSQSQRQGQGNRGAVETEDEEEDEFPDGQPPPSPTPPPPQSVESRTVPPMPPHQETPYDYFFTVDMPATSLDVPPEPSYGSREEMIQKKVFNERPAKKVERELEPEVVVEVKRSSKVVEEEVVAVPAPPPPPVVVVERAVKKPVKPKGSVNLLQVFTEIDDHFLKASESAQDVSKMLEATRLHYHSNFADNRGHIDHSARVMRVITWNRSFKGIPNFDDGGKDEFDTEELETHATVLDKLLAWEKKLYDEVKAGELMKFEYQKKVASLTKLKKKQGSNSEAFEKAKAAVSHLHTRYIVDMQSMDSTVSEINSLRDDQLYPKLVQLVAGMATMWEVMRYHHKSQSEIVIALRSFDISQCPKYTTDNHHLNTVQLWHVAQGWHMQFVELVSKQKEYVKALRNWLKLNLIPIESNLKEKVSSPPRIQNPAIQGLILEWNDRLEKLPDDAARTAINNFAGIIHTIVLKQEEEINMKEKCEGSRKELDRKKRNFEDWYHKYMNKNIPDEVDPERPEINVRSEVIAEKQFAVETVKKRLEEEEETYAGLCLQVREKSITSLNTALPELFRALADFAIICSDMYKSLNSRTTHHQSESSGRQ
ncbi:protein ROLLING AND ERECT LEAF 2-like [Argentina anserina]|uniref:protein ROLLING AND ERECT LEAF 2-like n=1 Tax=Argentina anserina TaxID=57926 RepID=UPI0021762EB2|nr:protein ROLLING AND ERECT LEAF 2-like [Potentilla anserina]XP_050384505.1 protein ROLLING AND ERECT LEAF 2-like [Potentilla anserina]